MLIVKLDCLRGPEDLGERKDGQPEVDATSIEVALTLSPKPKTLNCKPQTLSPEP